MLQPATGRNESVNNNSSHIVPGPPVSFGACCGLGHRMVRNLGTMVYALRQGRHTHACWMDIPWNEMFQDTATVTTGPRTKEFYGNESPRFQTPTDLATILPTESPVLQQYAAKDMRTMFHSPDAFSVVRSLHGSLSDRVRNKLEPLRKQYSSSLHMCAHFRLGNNETGDWARKKWRHVDDPIEVMKKALQAMLDFASTSKKTATTTTPSVSVFVASDSPTTRQWFLEHVPTPQWHVVANDQEDDLPEQGVWFGQHGSNTAANLTRETKIDKFADAVTDMFALGECDLLLIPTYSSFTVTSIILANSRNKTVLYRNATTYVPDPYVPDPYVPDPYVKPSRTNETVPHVMLKFLSWIGLN